MLQIKYIMVPALAVALFSAGYFAHSSKTKTKVVTEQHTVVVNHTVVVKKIVTKTVTLPGGTRHSTSTETDTTNSTFNVDAQDKNHSVAELPAIYQPNWSLNLTWTPRYSPTWVYPTEIDISRHILGPIWAVAGFNWYSHSASIGVRYDF